MGFTMSYVRLIYGFGNSHVSGKECVICMTEPKDTAVFALSTYAVLSAQYAAKPSRNLWRSRLAKIILLHQGGRFVPSPRIPQGNRMQIVLIRTFEAKIRIQWQLQPMRGQV
ncbi:uncharacterized protein LOC110658038 [Hevea brasiliensis]|uniref:uncharacterized protein LOC110658038 n=1 Tax=Hevea brasiliensis TaxID=3981 RepID=UPI0025CD8A70|nr:uncharacterized protein LOC110658038 [Hevea brasiliensis]